METSLFQEPTQAPQATPATPAVEPTVDPAVALLSTIKGEDGTQKYKDIPTALGALQHSQEYIKQLKQQLEEATQKASQAVTMEQVLAELKAPATPPTASQGLSPQPGLTATDVVKILQAQEAEKAAKANALKVAAKFKEVHGEKAEEVFYTKAAEMGLSRDAVNNLASTSPEAVFSMFGVKGEAAPAIAPPSGINTAGMQTIAPAPRETVMGFKSDKDLVGYWAKVKAEVYNAYGIKE